jgi:hypothetical protein
MACEHQGYMFFFLHVSVFPVSDNKTDSHQRYESFIIDAHLFTVYIPASACFTFSAASG